MLEGRLEQNADDRKKKYKNRTFLPHPDNTIARSSGENERNTDLGSHVMCYRLICDASAFSVSFLHFKTNTENMILECKKEQINFLSA